MVRVNNKDTRTRWCPANIYLFKVNNKKTRKRGEICSKLKIKTPERRQILQELPSKIVKLLSTLGRAFY